jgi:hypothetical protein
VDFVGPLPVSASFSYLFTIVDRKTHWPEAVLRSLLLIAQPPSSLAGFHDSAFWL